MTPVQKLLVLAETAERGGLIASALALYKKADRNSWVNGRVCHPAKEGIERMKERIK